DAAVSFICSGVSPQPGRSSGGQPEGITRDWKGAAMRHRLFASLVLLMAIPAAAQTPAKSETPRSPVKGWNPPRTPDGQPDLQGVWLNNSATPLERPKALEGRSSLTDEEVVNLRKRAARLFDGSNNSDFAGGDNFFLALLSGAGQYTNPNK